MAVKIDKFDEFQGLTDMVRSGFEIPWVEVRECSNAAAQTPRNDPPTEISVPRMCLGFLLGMAAYPRGSCRTDERPSPAARDQSAHAEGDAESCGS